MENEIANSKVKMCCPVMDTCQVKPVWFKPLFMNGREVNKKAVYQGHCIPHNENSHCADTGKTCPACVPLKYDKGEII